VTVTDPLNAVSTNSASSPHQSPLAATTIAPLATQSGGATTCSLGWHYVAASANSFVAGNCHEGWSFTVSYIQWDDLHTLFWYGGAIGGHYNGCGWMRETDIGVPTDYSQSSTCGSRTYCSYIHCDSLNNPYTYGTGTDGETGTSVAGCPKWANYRPWSSSSAPVDFVGYTTGEPNDVKVRYLAKNQYLGHDYYMVRDTRVKANHDEANWVFLRDDCIVGRGLVG